MTLIRHVLVHSHQHAFTFSLLTFHNSRGERPIQGQLSTPKFGTLYHFTKVSSDDFKVST